MDLDSTLGYTFYLFRNIDRLALLITDQQRIIEHDVNILGVSQEKWQCVYAAVPTHGLDRAGQTYPVYRILWASRLCEEKRPDLLVRIASELKGLMPALHICAFGSADPNSDWVSLLAEAPGLEYHGPFSGFDSLQPEGFDAFLYTSVSMVCRTLFWRPWAGACR